MISVSMLLGQRIREIREAQNIKQVQLANMIDIEPTNLSKIEKGIHFPKDDTINKILTALNIDIKNLFSFNHFKTKDELLRDINNILRESSIEDIQFFYKVLTAHKETHNTV